MCFYCRENINNNLLNCYQQTRQQTYGAVLYPPLTKTLTDMKDVIKKAGKEEAWKKIMRNATKEIQRQEKWWLTKKKLENREINKLKRMKLIFRDGRNFSVLLFINDIGTDLLNQRELIGHSWHGRTGVLISERMNWAQATTRVEYKNGVYSVHYFRTS